MALASILPRCERHGPLDSQQLCIQPSRLPSRNDFWGIPDHSSPPLCRCPIPFLLFFFFFWDTQSQKGGMKKIDTRQAIGHHTCSQRRKMNNDRGGEKTEYVRIYFPPYLSVAASSHLGSILYIPTLDGPQRGSCPELKDVAAAAAAAPAFFPSQ